jgi:hypothetical protein
LVKLAKAIASQMAANSSAISAGEASQSNC